MSIEQANLKPEAAQHQSAPDGSSNLSAVIFEEMKSQASESAKVAIGVCPECNPPLDLPQDPPKPLPKPAEGAKPSAKPGESK